QEAPEDEEVVLAAHRADEARPALGGDGGLLDDLLLAEEEAHHRIDARADPVGPILRTRREDEPCEAQHGPGEHPEGGDQEHREEDACHLGPIVTPDYARLAFRGLW